MTERPPAGPLAPSWRLDLPPWLVASFDGAVARTYATAEERMAVAVDLARRNVAMGTGGPFGAAIFESESGRLVAPGVNLVEPGGCSVLHAEIVAIIVAQSRLGTWDLGAPGLPAHEMAASTEPCSMCLGAVPWSGVRGLLTAARDEDARAIGFDEGAKPEAWWRELEARGIRVTRDVLRTEGRAVLEEYAAGGGTIYNSREGE